MVSHAESAQRAWGRFFCLFRYNRLLKRLLPELENSVLTVDPTLNALYNYPPPDEKSLQESRPWSKDPHFFKSVRISALALLKMVMHARSGGNLEVMGLMQGYVTSAGEFIVTDSFRLPVEGTETRVNAGDDANEYIINYLTQGRESGLRPENAVGWYHSHPGYGCWLSGIDVNTQRNQQQQGPWVAVVIDPDRTVSAGKVDIGAFRTFDEGYRAPASIDNNDNSFAPIPQGKVDDFGKYASHYYPLNVSHFKSTLDTHLLGLLWNKYWAATLSQTPLLTNHEYATKQIGDLALKVQHASRNQKPSVTGSKKLELEKDTDAIRTMRDPQLAQLVKTSATIAQEEMAGLLAEEIKQKLFYGVVEEALRGGETGDEVEEGGTRKAEGAAEVEEMKA